MGHIHAAAMAEYAKDAAETDKPWERWQVMSEHGSEVYDLQYNPSWDTYRKYRRKPKFILINGNEVPEPHRTPLKDCDTYWTLTFFDGVVDTNWVGDKSDYTALKNGFIHLTKEAAQRHYEALKSFTFKEDSDEYI